MKKEFNGNEQALVAVLYEVRKLGIDLSELSDRVRSGIMGNNIYTWVSAEYKSKVIEAFEKAVETSNVSKS